MFNYRYLPGKPVEYDDPLYNSEMLNGLVPQYFESHLDVKLVREEK